MSTIDDHSVTPRVSLQPTCLQLQSNVAIDRAGGIQRRDFLRLIGSAGLTAGGLTWCDHVAAESSKLRARGMACILLWMQGGPSQFETFSPKPGHANGGETKAISTSVPGIEISENLPHLARRLDDLCIIRSMNSKEGSHPRATFLLHTGYLPTASVKYPTFGSVVSQQLGDPSFDLPSFVRIGQARGLGGAGLLGVDYDPFVVTNASQLPENTVLTTGQARYDRRLNLLNDLEADFEERGGKREVEDHRKLYEKAAKFVTTPMMSAFDVDREPLKMKEHYGKTQFGTGCLLARRLVETGVTFVEVLAGNWDTHDNNFERSRELCGHVDQPIAALLTDLRERGMLDTTLVVWMGEFGRTPRINPRTGRDHYPRAFSVALAGGGIRGGQVIGRTDAGGVDVSDRPVTVSDLFRTLCHSLKINPDTENMSNVGRPIKIVDGGSVVHEVFAG